MSLLPSRGPDASTSQDGDIQVLGVDEDVSAVLDALSSETARKILNAVYDEPATPSELADRLEMSIQKVSYHLEKLEDEELIAVAGTQYSEKGQEMTVYEPPDDPLVVFVGTPERKQSLRSLVTRLLPAIGLLTVASALVQGLLTDWPNLFGPTGAGDSTDGGAESAGTPEPTDDGGGVGIMETTETPEPEAAEVAQEATEIATTAASGGAFEVEPGVAFFLGGLLVIAIVAVTLAYSDLR